MLYRMILAVSVSLSLLAGSAIAGEFSDKVDRFTGDRSVSWIGEAPPKNSFSVHFYGLVPDGSPRSENYILILKTWSDNWQHLKCNSANWLVDGERSPWIKTKYEREMTDGIAFESFVSVLTSSEAKRLSAAEKVEFSICGYEGELSNSDVQGLVKVISVTE